MSPSGKITVPERTGLSSSSEVGLVSTFASGFFGALGSTTQLRPPESNGGIAGVSRASSTPSMPSTRMLRS